ncbi:Josephin domain containing 3, isoform CRA_c [Rattus norvegicus]|uniref:Josephin domain containing 3, isoform CRA_c n=1 Tax=Rattus norvegicus TaxID=10116 RepID=A6JNC7_RAT|nr:Josephin domain containing 3, isoform CRA_c [Rattus norvegicus]
MCNFGFVSRSTGISFIKIRILSVRNGHERLYRDVGRHKGNLP